MPAHELEAIQRKRKYEELTSNKKGQSLLTTSGQLEIPNDDEDGGGIESDDGQVDEFPQLDTDSESDNDVERLVGEAFGIDDEDENENEGEDEPDEETDENSDFDSDSPTLRVFPESKMITSGITGQPKRIYPDIEPDYDSDSSTEDVSVV